MTACFRTTLICAAVLTATATLGSEALAQAPPGADPAQQADDHFLMAKALMKAGKKQEAYNEYKTAWGLKRTYDIAANLGGIELELHMPRDAAEHFAFALRTYAVTGVTADKLALMRRALTQARAQVGAVKVTVNENDAEVLVDGRAVGRAPLEDEVFVDPGRHEITARLGAKTSDVTLEINAGEQRQVALSLGRGGPGWGWVIASAVLAVGGIAAGAGLTVAANSKASDAMALRGQLGSSSACFAKTASGSCAALSSAVSSRDSFTNAAVGTFVAGGVFTLAAVSLGVWQASATRAPATALRVVPVFSASTAGVVLSGAW